MLTHQPTILGSIDQTRNSPRSTVIDISEGKGILWFLTFLQNMCNEFLRFYAKNGCVFALFCNWPWLLPKSPIDFPIGANV